VAIQIGRILVVFLLLLPIVGMGWQRDGSWIPSQIWEAGASSSCKQGDFRERILGGNSSTA
jgi:hypothetical protein